MKILDRIEKGEASISVLGLGYVGLPIALAFAKKARVVGFDINDERVEMMKNEFSYHFHPTYLLGQLDEERERFDVDFQGFEYLASS